MGTNFTGPRNDEPIHHPPPSQYKYRKGQHSSTAAQHFKSHFSLLLLASLPSPILPYFNIPVTSLRLLQKVCNAMMGKRAQWCLNQQSFLGRRHARVSVTALASVAVTSAWPNNIALGGSLQQRQRFSAWPSLFSPGRQYSVKSGIEFPSSPQDNEWTHLLPFEEWPHNSAKIVVPGKGEHGEDKTEDMFDRETFSDRLNSTVATIRELEKSSVWVEVPITRSSLIEEMTDLGFQFHHAQGDRSVLNLWLKNSDSLVPEFATHHIGVGALVINSRDEVLCVREIRKQLMKWKIPGGLADLGEHIDEAAVREVFEETGIRTTFRNVVCFRHTHGMANGRSDIYFVCRLDLIEEKDVDGNVVIPEPVPQEEEIAATSWVPYSEFRDMVMGENGHPMISHVLRVSERGDTIERKLIHSILPGRKANPIYSAPVDNVNDS